MPRVTSPVTTVPLDDELDEALDVELDEELDLPELDELDDALDRPELELDELELEELLVDDSSPAVRTRMPDTVP